MSASHPPPSGRVSEMKWSDVVFAMFLVAMCVIMYGLTVLIIHPLTYHWTQPPDDMCNVWEH